MSLKTFMTTTASTKRHPAMASGKIGDPVTNLSSLLITPLMLANNQTAMQLRQALGLEGTLVQLKETYTQSHTHTDSSVSVTQMPDIVAGDKLVVGSITYNVQWVDQQPATSGFGATLIIYVTEDKRG